MMSKLERNIQMALREVPGVAAVYLFGSQATGSANKRSDIDIAILFERGGCPDKLRLFELKCDLENTLGSDVDLVCLNSASPIIGMQVFRYGRELFAPNPHARDRFIMSLVTDYHDLKIIRKPIEDSILQRRIYG